MVFLRTPQPEDYLDTIQAGAVVLRPPAHSDYAEWAEVRAVSRAHLTPWEPVWPRDELLKSSYRRRLKAYAREVRDDQGYAFFIANAASGALMGGISLSNVRRGAAQTATLGYWLGLPHTGRGHMRDAASAIVSYAFRTLLLHRIEAACMLNNQPSMRVLEACAFTREGVAKRYLKINGQWEDHFLYARTETCDDGGALAKEARR